jgi:hypothetical protein
MRHRRVRVGVRWIGLIAIVAIGNACVSHRAIAAEPGSPQDASLEAKIRSLQEKLDRQWEIRNKLVETLKDFNEKSMARDAILQIQGELERRDGSIATLMAAMSAAAAGDEVSEAVAANEVARTADSSLEERRLIAYRRHEEAQREAEERIQAAFAPLPAIADPQTAVYQLSHVEAKGIADALMRIFGSGQMRVAIGDDPKTLIVVATMELADDVEELVQSLDVQPSANRGAVGAATANPAAGPRSLLVRIFWVADHLPEGEGQELATFLPFGVIEAFENLGLESPRVVTQTVNSVARPATDRSADPVSFATTTQVISPSIAATQLKSNGVATLNNEGRVDLNVEIELSGGTNCQVAGTITAPLGHYVVLGTANSMVLDPKSAAAGPTVDPATGQGFAGGGRGGMGFDGGRGYDPGMGMGSMPFGGTLPPNMKSSRLAFVIQVIENKSHSMDGNE